MKCPNCRSERIDKRNYGTRTGAVVGGVTGGAGAVVGATTGAAVGVKAVDFISSATGDDDSSISIFAKITAGLIGAGAGMAVGATVGKAIDEHVLDNYKCLECEFTFNEA